MQRRKPVETQTHRPIRSLMRPWDAFTRLEASGGLLLMGAMVLALAWANSPWAASYVEAFRKTYFTVGLGEWSLSKPTLLWINDGLMALFFLLVGLEIKRELLTGELAGIRRAILPVAAAVGGMVVPALIYFGFNPSGPPSDGWGIPMATDIAFALGILSLAGRAVPTALKVFLVAFAIVDDLGAVAVIALFYTDAISLGALGAAAALIVLLVLLNRLGVRRALPYMVVGVVLWYAVLKSGVHATVAGVLLAWTLPHRQFEDDTHTPLETLEEKLHPWVTFGILPLFALANAGVALGGSGLGRLGDPIALGIMLGLVVGKQIGVFGAAWIALKAGWASRPEGVNWGHIYGAALLGGVGFTMSLFIAGLAFGDLARLETAKLAILAASLISGVAGWFVVRAASRTGDGA